MIDCLACREEREMRDNPSVLYNLRAEAHSCGINGCAYHPPSNSPPLAVNAGIGFKFSRGVRILDQWWLIGGTKWSRTLFRLKHPIVYSKRGLRNLYRRIRRLFVKDKVMQCRTK